MTYTDFGLHKTGTGIEDTGAYDIVLVGIARISWGISLRQRYSVL